MPKLLFSKVRFYELKDLMPNVKFSRRVKLGLGQKRRKHDIQHLGVRKFNNETKQSLQMDQKLHLTLERLLKDEKYLAAFRSFLKSEFSEENIEFWLECEDFKSSTTTNDLRAKAEKIYEEFIQPAAPREINVDHHIREKIKTSLGNPCTSCFDEAQKHVFLLMESDSCRRFLRSDAFLSLKRKSRTKWYI
ncbi:regulator of G-protein signaling 21-like [Gouania willdenowi]|uniref:regulator of G-protein signaling 21-like n=1 Tax=Gouania willdenowi TaxID=441366 RepID=UPI001055EF99|nr:regulator of G-protein signaling 21-like [Gouania willdenowi]